MLFPNWADSNRIRPTHTRTDLRAAWGLDDKFVVLYSGATGIKQGLDMLLDCAALMKDEPGVRFVIVGDGGERPRLERLARERELGNVIFQPLQPVEALNDLLATADVSVIPQKAGVKEIVLPSKLGNILASGRPIVVSAAEDSDLARAVFDGECGEVVQPGAAGQMVGAIRKLMASPQLRERYGRNGRRVVDTRMSESVTLDLFLGRLELLAERPVKAGDAGLAPVQVGARNDVGGT
jgi:colanic acid biosynthesis glycosyl transferase WcaI